MKKTILTVALAAGLAMTASANAQDLLAFWNFNNTNNDSDRLNSTGDDGALGSTFVHMYDSNFFEDGWYDPNNGILYPVQDAFEAGNPGALIQNADPGTGSMLTESVFIDVSGLNGDGEANGTAGGDWGSFSGTTSNEPGVPFAGGSLAIQGDGNNGNSFIINADLTMYEDLVVSWANRGTSTGFNARVVDVSTDGINWTTVFSDAGALSSTWVVESFTTGLLDDSATAMIRFTIDGASSAFGNNRFDNIVLEGTKVPEPTSLALLALGGIAAMRRRRA